MNANEVIANLALELLGHGKGDYDFLDPIDDVNRSQSTNDVYPTAIKLALVFGIDGSCRARQAAPRVLREGPRVPAGPQDRPHAAAGRRADDARTGVHRLRHHARRGLQRLNETRPSLIEINMGATAIGTGITADPRYAEAVRGTW